MFVTSIKSPTYHICDVNQKTPEKAITEKRKANQIAKDCLEKASNVNTRPLKQIKELSEEEIKAKCSEIARDIDFVFWIQMNPSSLSEAVNVKLNFLKKYGSIMESISFNFYYREYTNQRLIREYIEVFPNVKTLNITGYLGDEEPLFLSKGPLQRDYFSRIEGELLKDIAEGLPHLEEINASGFGDTIDPQEVEDIFVSFPKMKFERDNKIVFEKSQ